MTGPDPMRLYVPAEGAITRIAPGSAIVGGPDGDRVGVDFEKGGPSNVRTFDEKLHHAAGRRAQDYPTVARALLSPDSLVDVGSARYDALLRHWVVEEIDDHALLTAWAGESVVVGGSLETRRECGGRLYSRLNANGVTDVAMSSCADVPIHETVIAVAGRPGRMRQ